MGRTTTIILLVLLVATNLVWLVATVNSTGDAIPEADKPPPEVATLRERVRELEADLEKARSEPTLTGRKASEPAEETSKPAPAKPPARPARPAQPRPSPEARRTAAQQVGQWKADVLQIESPAQRESGLRALEDGMRSSDPVLAAASLRSLNELRDASYEKSRFREAVRSRTEDENDRVRNAALRALMRVEPEPEDVDRVIRAAEAHPEDTGILILGAWMSKARIEGALADLYVKALQEEGPREVKNTANQLRGMWVTAEVEQAAVDAYRRAHEVSPGLWFHILGQFRPTREPRVRLIFEILATAGHDAPQLLARALDKRNLDPSATTLAADLALETLPKAPNALTRRLCLEVLHDVGTVAHVGGVRAYAENPMVDAKLREQAAKVAETIEKR